MQVFFDRLANDQAFFLQTVIIIVLFVLLLVTLIMLFRLKKTVKVVTHNQDGMSIETVINQYYVDIEELKAVQSLIQHKQEEISIILQHCLSKIGVVRFNPFAEVGGDQSFAIAMLDNENNGVVISSLYNRTNSRFYGKPIANGQSTYTLSDEEQEALRRAMEDNEGK